ncbi:MAG: dihydrolipoamide dehydrogenase [Gammaproteobacteria bacterium]|nr:dihydrolipoamide dehydrogenase [Gammaproteobacteria bacterium]
MEADLRRDVAIIGAGTAGLSAERAARGAGASTVLIDEEFKGTTCASVGCMPSKLLIAAAAAAHSVRRASTFGIQSSCEIDGAAVMARVRRERDSYTASMQEQIARLPKGVTLQGKAEFVDSTTLTLDDGRRVEARAVVIATGSHPSIPESFAGIRERILTNETIFELPELPQSLAVVGAGPLGLELAQAMARLGVPVAVFDEKTTLAGVKDPAVAACMQAAFKHELEVHLGVKIHAELVNGAASIRWEGATNGERSFARVLLAVGRPPNLASLNLPATGLSVDERGIPLFDRETLRCGASAIFIAGDADGDRPVLHEALADGSIAGYNAATFPDVTPRRRSVPFSIMFTDPPLALIGRQSGEGVVCGESDYGNQGRAQVEARAQGLLKIYARRHEAVLTGAALFCPGADHLGHLLAWAIDAGVDAGTLLARPFYHPTLEEGLKPALRQVCERARVQLPPMQDPGSPAGA